MHLYSYDSGGGNEEEQPCFTPPMGGHRCFKVGDLTGSMMLPHGIVINYRQRCLLGSPTSEIVQCF